MTDGTVKDIEDEIPFELPEGWAWCHFGDIATVINGKNQSKVENPNGKYPIYGSGGIMGRADYYICPKNCTIIGRKGSINNPIFVEEKFWNVDTAFGLYPSKNVLPKHLFYFCKYFDFTKLDSSTTLPSLTKTNIQRILFPLPPLTEQERIVSEIENTFAKIDILEQNQAVLQTSIKQAKSKILDLAIHGKLVAQDPNDEPASVLLEKLRAEKEAKIKSGELKRDKNDSYIYKSATDNCHYQRFADGTEEPLEITNEIPQNWTWCSLGEISTKLKRGKSPTYTEKSSIMAFAQKCNQKEGPTTLEKALYIDESTLKKYSEEEKMQFNDIVINSTGTGTLGRVGIFNCKIPDDVVAVYPDSHVSSVRINPSLFAKYFYYFVKNKQNYLEEMGEGSTNQKELKIDTIANLIVPLPPLAEQKRIVEKIDNAFAKLDFIAEQLA